MLKGPVTGKRRYGVLAFLLLAAVVLELAVFCPLPASALSKAPGDDVDVIISVNSSQLGGKDVRYQAVFFIEYDMNAFDFVDAEGIDKWVGASLNNVERNGNGSGFGSESIANSGYGYNINTPTSSISTFTPAPDGTDVLKVTLRIKAEAELGTYNFRCYAKSGGLGAALGFVTVTPASVEVAQGGGGSDPVSPYTVKAVSESAAATVGDAFNVDVMLSADPAVSGFASMQAYLNYDAALTAVTGDLDALQSEGLTVSEDPDPDKPGQLFISRTGDSIPVDAEGVSIVRIPFTARAAGKAVFTVTDPKASLTGETASTVAQAGDDLTVVIAEVALITFDLNYAGAPEGYQLLRYRLEAKPDAVYTYDGEPMGYACIDGIHYVTYIVGADVTEATAETVAATTDVAPVPDGDINGDSVLEIVDAQIVYDLAKGIYDGDADCTTLTVAQRLKADANGDGAVTADDAYAIQYKLHYGTWN
jgi:hypothetical protein